MKCLLIIQLHPAIDSEFYDGEQPEGAWHEPLPSRIPVVPVPKLVKD